MPWSQKSVSEEDDRQDLLQKATNTDGIFRQFFRRDGFKSEETDEDTEKQK